jgi:hypothetical protein
MRKMLMLMISALMVVGLAAPAFADEGRSTDRDRREHSHETWRSHDRDDWRRFDRDNWRRHHDRDDWWWSRHGWDRDRDDD